MSTYARPAPICEEIGSPVLQPRCRHIFVERCWRCANHYDPRLVVPYDPVTMKAVRAVPVDEARAQRIGEKR